LFYCGRQYNTDYLYKLLTVIVVCVVVYSSLPVMGTAVNIICITWHLSVPHPAELLLKQHLCLKIIFLALAASMLEPDLRRMVWSWGKYGVITLPNPNTEQYFHIVWWLGCDIVVHYEGIFSQFWWLLPSCMAEMVQQKWLVIMLTHSCCGVGWQQELLGHLTPKQSSSSWVMDCVETCIFKALDDTIDRTRVLVHRSLPILHGFQLSYLICPICVK
jgi:hypothetical protein